jgi:hypothetical protein
MIDIVLTGVKIWLGAFALLAITVFLLHVANKFDD